MRQGRRIAALHLAILGLAISIPRGARADTVTLESGVAYTGEVDKDNTLVSVFTPTKRTLFRDTKVATIARGAVERYETFHVDQPLVVHGGVLPAAAMAVKAGEWDEQGRRTFEYRGPGSDKPVRMAQAINQLGPKTIQFRGIDGFWRAPIETTQVPRSVVLGLLAKVDRQDQNERLKVGRFLIQAEWYDEALAELDGIARDFPDLAETATRVRATVVELQARRRLAQIERLRKVGQPAALEAALKQFPTAGAPGEVVATVHEMTRGLAGQASADAALAARVRKAAEALGAEAREANSDRTLAMLGDLARAPDAVRDRFGPFTSAPDGASAEARYALALSGWVAGPEAATESLPAAEALAEAGEALARYLAGATESDRAEPLEQLRKLEASDPATGAPPPVGTEALARIAAKMLPPLRDARDEQPGRPLRLRARDDENPEPTEYVALLPPEYHPRRNYPAVVALHSGGGPDTAARWWGEEAARRGYLVIAPEYNLAGRPRDYRYTSSEHAAVQIALRDALKRFAIDPDRVFLGGVLLGGNMAWDFGLAHPDLFAGVAIVSGLPAKYVWAYRNNAKLVPTYAALGDLAPAETDVILPFGTSLISRNYDATYVEYFKRGLEALPEELPTIFDWMDGHRREPYPKEFEVATAREGDDRFFGTVVREFAPKRTTPPEQADPLGKNLKPATIAVKARTQANLLDINTSGITRLDVWLGPPHIDLTRKLELRINGRTHFKDLPKLDISPFLEDLRVRGDRKQVYWLRYQANLSSGRPR
jgi:acetyl esterase/lipase